MANGITSETELLQTVQTALASRVAGSNWTLQYTLDDVLASIGLNHMCSKTMIGNNSL